MSIGHENNGTVDNFPIQRNDIRSLIYCVDGGGMDRIVPSLLEAGYNTIVLYEKGQYRMWGWQSGDYTDGMLVFHAADASTPFRPIGADNVPVHIVAFYPDIFRHTPFEQEADKHTFFHYRVEEALHLSMCEKRIIEASMNDIEKESEHTMDEYSRPLLAKRIELLIDYGARFYERQFTTRYLSVQDILQQYDQWVKRYVANKGFGAGNSLLCRDCAMRFGLSEAYFSDLLKSETGMSHEEYIDQKCIELARRMLRETQLSIARIASDLGFISVRDFSSFFKKIEGCSPNEFRYFC